MTREEIIQGLQFTIDIFLFDPLTGEPITKPRNDMDKTTIDACKGAIELLKQEPCDDAISMMDLLNNLHKHFSKGFETDEWWNSTHVLQAVKDCRPELFDLNYALSAQPKQTECEDAISRAEAVRVASGYCHPSNIAKELAKLPPVQPKLTECEDTISRQAAIEVAKQYWYKPDIAGALAELPPVQPMPKAGHWIHHPEIDFVCAEHWECSVCHKSTMINPVCKVNDYNNMYFCPKCGARMIEPREESEE